MFHKPQTGIDILQAHKRQQNTQEKQNWLWEFSKKIVFTVTIIFVIFFLYACILLWHNPDSTAIPSLIENMCDVFKVTVVSYAVKAGLENVTKIKKSYMEDEP